MELIDVKEVRIGDMVFPVRETTRSKIEFENLSGITYYQFVSSFSTVSTENQFKYFYCIAKAGAEKKGTEFKYSFEEFLSLTDDHYTEALTNFYKAIIPKPGGEGKKQRVKSST